MGFLRERIVPKKSVFTRAFGVFCFEIPLGRCLAPKASALPVVTKAQTAFVTSLVFAKSLPLEKSPLVCHRQRSIFLPNCATPRFDAFIYYCIIIPNKADVVKTSICFVLAIFAFDVGRSYRNPFFAIHILMKTRQNINSPDKLGEIARRACALHREIYSNNRLFDRCRDPRERQGHGDDNRQNSSYSHCYRRSQLG